MNAQRIKHMIIEIKDAKTGEKLTDYTGKEAWVEDFLRSNRMNEEQIDYFFKRHNIVRVVRNGKVVI